VNNGPEHTRFAEGSSGEDLATVDMETALRQALRPEDPPAGFADRLMARAAAGERPAALTANTGGPSRPAGKLLAWPAHKTWTRGAIAAALILGLLEAESTYTKMREQQRRIAAATAQFQTTERVTVRALAQAREQLQKAGVPLTFD
jgi:hypothetical protein